MTDETITSLRCTLRGELLTAGTPEYDAARTLWNGMIDKRPALIVRCRGAADVITAVTFAREHGLLLSARGGGHNVAGLALCDGGLTIDLSLMRGIRVDAAGRTVRAERGVTWGELDREALSFGLATTGGMVPMDQASDVLRFYRDYSHNAPDDLTAFAGLLTTPDGLDVVAIIAAWFGPAEQAEKHLAPLRKFGSPVADLLGELSYRDLQTMFDPACPAGLRRYWKSGYFPELPDDLFDLIVEHAALKTSPYSLILILHMHGKASRAAGDMTAFGARAEQWDFDIIPQWQAPTEDARHIDWARNFWKETERFTRGVYSNHLDTDDGATPVRAAYGQNYERLALMKRKYDPENLFKVNHNITPAVLVPQ